MKLCILGTGYVGLVSAACFAEMGNIVTCVDVNPVIVDSLRQGGIHIFEPGLEDMVRRNMAENRLAFTTDTAQGLEEAECVFITVGTPPLPDGSCDLNFVRQAAADIGHFMKAPLIVVDKSTVPVGTADQVRAIIENELAVRGLSIPFDVVSNPEFLKEGDAVADFMKPDRVVLGVENRESAAKLRQLYSPYARSRDKVLVMSARSAEMTKYAANCMLATKISFINEIACICEQVGADVREVRAGIGSDQRIGYHFIYPGVGYGGSCFPKDVKALIYTARSAGHAPSLLEAVDAVNMRQKRSMARRIRDYFAPQGGVKDKKLALWGLAFKANTDDLREAAALDIVADLTSHGMSIAAFDPAAGKNAAQLLKDNPLVQVLDEQYSVCRNADALLVVTEWNQFRNPDFLRVKKLLKAPLLFDGRNLYDPAVLAGEGYAYFCVGKG